MKQEITLEFPVWDFFFKQEEITKLLDEEFGFEGWAPGGVPKRITVKNKAVDKVGAEDPNCPEVDRLEISSWAPGGQYIKALIVGRYSSYGTYWSLVSYKVRFQMWVDRLGKYVRVEINATEEEVACCLENAAHSREKEQVSRLKKVLKIKYIDV